MIPRKEYGNRRFWIKCAVESLRQQKHGGGWLPVLALLLGVAACLVVAMAAAALAMRALGY